MSAKVVEIEIERFLSTSTPEVLCITGAWGVGKTYSWQKCLENFSFKENSAGLNQYSYVSIFGQNNLESIRSAIVQNVKTLKTEGDKASPGNGLRSVKRHLGKVIRVGKYADGVAPEKITKLFELVGNAAFYTLNPTIVCIDDLERLDENSDFTLIHLLGLANQLKEQKNCKVVLLLNADELGDGKDKFHAQLEKVADRFLTFDPTPEETARIGIDKDTPHADLLKEFSRKLKIKNIRIIKRIESECIRIQDIMGTFDEDVLTHAMRSAALFTLSKYDPERGPTFEYVKSVNRFGGAGADNEQEDWNTLLNDLEFFEVYTIDAEIHSAVGQGYYNTEKVLAEARNLEEIFRLRRKDHSYQEAWDLYHDSFDDNQEQVLDKMYDAFKKCHEAITPVNVSGAARLFKELGRPKQSEELVRYHVENREDSAEFWDLEASPFRDSIRDEDVKKYFREKFLALQPVLDPREVLLRISKNSGYNQSDIAALSKVSTDDFFNMFKSTRGKDQRRIITEGLRFRTRGQEDSPEYAIYLRANEALDRIADESKINARRVAQRRGR